MASSSTCPIIINCNDITKMDCANRNYTECEYFKHSLEDYCKRHYKLCGNCRYRDACTVKSKYERRY